MYDIVMLSITIAISMALLLLVLRRQLDSVVVSTMDALDEKLQGAFDQLGDTLEEVFTAPMAKRAMSIIGKQGGNSASQSGLVDKMAQDILNGPQLAGIKMIGSALGLDIDGYLEDHGAMNTLAAIKQFAPMMNIDLGNVAVEGLSAFQGNNPSGGKNPYLP